MRRLLLIALFIVLVLPLPTHAAGTARALTWLDVYSLAIRLDKALDNLPVVTVDVTADSLADWSSEIVPYFEENGMISTGVYPTEIKIKFYPDARGALHIAGQSNCGTLIAVNERFSRPVSTWYRRVWVLSVLVHELAHVQQGPLCAQLPTQKVETTAQIVSIEVMASMALSGNKAMRAAFLDEFRDIVMSTAWYYGTKPAYRQAYLDLLKKVYDSEQRGRQERAFLSWKGQENALQNILLAYSAIPLQTLMAAHWSGKPIPDLAIPAKRPFAADDFSYFLDHLEDLSK